MRNLRIDVFKVLLLVPMLGCVNPYRANFNSTRERYPKWLESRFAPPASKPRLMITGDIQAANWDLLEKGHIMVGFSKFDGPQIETELALKEAKSVQADVVLVQKKFSKSLTETVSLTQWGPSETTEIRAVMIDSPAYEADLLKGDIILKIDEEPAPSAPRFYEEIITRAGKQMKLSIKRADKTFERRVSLNP